MKRLLFLTFLFPSLAFAEPSMEKLELALTAKCSIDGFSIGSWIDKKTWRIDYSKSTTSQQKLDCENVVALFNPNDTKNQAPKFLQMSVILQRLTVSEYGAIKIAANNELQSGNGQISLWLDLGITQGRINLNSDATQAVKNWLVGKSIMSAARVTEVLAPY